MKRLAIYDMDRTITVRPTFTPFLVHAALTLNPLRLLLLPVVAIAILFYGLKAINRAKLKEVMQTLLLGRSVDPAKLAGVVDSFAEKTASRNIRRGAPARVAQDKAEGYHLVLATASYRLYAEAIGLKMGFDDVIATNTLVGLDTRIMAKIDGENCYGPAKLRMVTAWMKNMGVARGDAHIRFYSDHVSDAPVLAYADEAFAVNAHGPLQKLARNMKWNIVDWS
ncbi:MAG: family hydrolase [Sphingomonadales bacterium]|jgi:HAD superfamily phosphoserine phosphatase-like hydrolase|nr:family hydrolase [Sphingomonadales bacterium]